MKQFSPVEMNSTRASPRRRSERILSKKASACTAKLSLGFILNGAVAADASTAASLLKEPEEDKGCLAGQSSPLTPKPSQARRCKSKSRSKSDPNADTSRDGKTNTKSRGKHSTKPELTYEEKRRARKCTIEGCLNYTINSGRCFRHGGGKKCTEDGCNASAKVAGLCWKHGGSIQCVMDGCDRRGKSRGLCWAHGGGTKCQASSCSKVAVSNGFCWAHGGGKRCAYDGCQRPAYERTYNYCTKHYDRLQHGHEIMEV